MLSKFWKDSKRSIISLKEPQPQGRGMTHRADKFFAKKMAGGLELEWPALRTVAGSPDGYHSAKETSDFDDDTEEEAQEVESDVELMVKSDNSDMIVPSGRTVPLFIANAAQQKIGTRIQLDEDLRPRILTELRMPRRGSKAELRMERSPRWCCPCSEIPKRKERWSMPIGEPKLRSISRRVTRITRSKTQCCSPWRERLARISGIVMNMVTCCLLRSLNGWTCPIMPPSDFWDLNAQLCGLKQGAFESPKDYYNRMVDIGVALWEYHQDCFQPGELSCIEKECFFARLRDQSKYLVSHMKDKREYGPVDMLKELRENDEARYPANTAHHPGKPDGYGQNASHPDRKGLGYIALPTNVEPYPDVP